MHSAIPLFREFGPFFERTQNGFPLAHDFGTYCATTHRLIHRNKTIFR